MSRGDGLGALEGFLGVSFDMVVKITPVGRVGESFAYRPPIVTGGQLRYTAASVTLP
jgi:hypothetical protein